MYKTPHGREELQLWVGKPGHGKTLQAIELMAEWLHMGHPVISNINMTKVPRRRFSNQLGKFVYLEESKFTTPVVVEGQDKPVLPAMLAVYELIEEFPGKHVLFVIDEAHELFPAATTAVASNQAISGFLSKHRHLGISIIAITQDESQIYKKFRTLAQVFRRHENLAQDPILDWILCWFTTNLHMAYSVTVAGGKVGRKAVIFDRKYYRVKKKYAECYNTRQTHEMNVEVAKIKPPGRWRVRIVWAGLILFASAAVNLLFFARSLSASNSVVVSQQVVEPREIVSGTVVSAWDRGDGQTVYVVETSEGEREVELPSRYYGLEKNYDVVGQPVVVSVPGARTEGLVDTFKRTAQ